MILFWTMGAHARHTVLVSALVIAGICIFGIACLLWAEWTGAGKPMRELNERQVENLRRKGLL